MKSRRHFRAVSVVFQITLILILGCAPLMAQDCPVPCLWERGDPHQMHWPQAPDQGFTGVGVGLSGTTLADDFVCTATGPIRTIHLWGSFRDDLLPQAGPDSLTFELCIYSDPREGAQTTPAALLWRRTFKPGQYTATRVHQGPEDWYDPIEGTYINADHRDTWRYTFCIEQDPFIQEVGNVHWLAVRRLYASDNTAFAWKTTAQRFRWSNDAMYLHGNNWSPMVYPKGHTYSQETLDLAFVLTDGGESQLQADFGDAPDSSNSVAGAMMTAYPNGTPANFPTAYLIGPPPYGPMHQYPRDMFYLGHWVSLETDADVGMDEDRVNNLNPADDVADRDGGDDGLQLPLVMPSCGTTTLSYTVTVTNTAAKQAYVNVWCDWNRDGDWNDTAFCPDGAQVPEWAVQNQKITLPAPGTHAFATPSFRCWHPAGSVGPIWVRIMIAEQRWQAPSATVPVGGAGPYDGYLYGETEDYFVVPLEEPKPVQYDWGDAPDAASTPAYPTLKANNGARHEIAGPWLGDEHGRPDAETDGKPHANALGDDNSDSSDEKGVSIPPLVQGRRTSATVRVNGGGGVVQAWIDFNGDHTWQNDEMICDTFLPDGIHEAPFTVPSVAAVGRTFARFRISRQGGLAPTGAASDGEVEDCEVRIDAAPDVDKMWCQLPDLGPHGAAIFPDGNESARRTVTDDFTCTHPGRLSHIRLWGSWKNDSQGTITRIRVRIHANDPAGQNGSDMRNSYAKPDLETLWQKEFTTGQFEQTRYHVNQVAGQWWWDLSAGQSARNSNARAEQIDIEVGCDEAFQQNGTPDRPKVYWLAVEIETLNGQFGWNTRQWLEPFQGNALWYGKPCTAEPWQELYYPMGHAHYDVERNHMDMAFCLLFSEAPCEPGTNEPGTNEPVTNEMVTSRPASVTQCPVVETFCPAVETVCRPAITTCPTVETVCQTVQTACPVVATQCPTTETKCPLSITTCPTVQTVCPGPATQCPAVHTQCPAMETLCPTFETQCPVAPTQCPTQQTRCPISQTQCPTIETACPQTATHCPLPTWCPATPTSCPLVLTQCPTISTLCPATETSCPPATTTCPATSLCGSGTCPPCVLPGQDGCTASLPTLSCPVVETDCVDINGYLDIMAALR